MIYFARYLPLHMEEQSHAFTREQKVGYGVVVICGVLAVVLGMFYMVHHLHKPFLINYTGNRVLIGEAADAEEIARQKRADTDGDGVSDYDELHVYGSSPYLSDTDSDGMTDDFEITSGMDPACASGQKCAQTQEEVTEQTFVDEQAADAATQAQQAADEYQRISAMLQGMSADDIRQILVESGGDPAEIAALSDEEVQTLYGEVVSQLESSGGLDALIEQVAAQSGS